MPLVRGVTASAFVTFLATGGSATILGELRRRSHCRALHPDSPSLHGTPTVAELKTDCAQCPRSLHIRLHIGSRLADLEPTLNSGKHGSASPTGVKRIHTRGRGMRAYIADNRLLVSCSTLMRYRLLA